MANQEEDFSDMEEFGDDPVAFLDELREEYPPLMSILNQRQIRLLAKSPKDPYLSEGNNVNEEFLNDMAACYKAKTAGSEGRKALQNALLAPVKEEKTVEVDKSCAPLTVLKKLECWMRRCISQRLEVTEATKGEVSLPRVVRLARRYKFSDCETSVLYFTVVDQAGLFYDGSGRIGFGGLGGGTGGDVLSVCHQLEVSLLTILEFLNPDRQHMQNGLLPDINQTYILTNAIRYDGEVMRALLGGKLSSSDFLKLEHTPLADIVAEEPGNEHYRKGLMEPSGKVKGGAGELVVRGTAIRPPPGGMSKADPGQDAEGMPEGEGELMDDEEDPGEKEEEEPVTDLADLLKKELKYEKMRKEEAEAKEEEGGADGEDKEIEDEEGLKPYKKDLEYLDDHFAMIIQTLKVKQFERRIELEEDFDDGGMYEARYKRQKREAESKLKVCQKTCAKRLALTRLVPGGWVPRLERMVESRGLGTFETNVLLSLIGSVIQPNKFSSFDIHINPTGTTIRDLLRLFCNTLEEQISHRRYFYKSSVMVHEGMVNVQNYGLSGDTSNATVELDRRMLDFCVGLDTEFSEIVEGSHLYYPKTKFDQVILSKDQKKLILDTVSNFEGYKRCRKRLGMDDVITYGAGMVMLFYGPPGTGKTMMANALANQLGKKILLINFPSLGTMTAGENFKFIFRESKINDAILFFDECEAIFESREKGGHDVNLLLTEIERHDGLIILATNRPYDLDEAMHRRIMLAIEFRQPDHLLRKAIWKCHIPEQMKVADDIDLDELSTRFELTGGFIKNAVLSAVSIAVSREGDNPVVTQKDFAQGAGFQLRGRLRMKDFDRRVIPVCGLEEVVVDDKTRRALRDIINFEKARSVLFGQWGFGKRVEEGLTVLLHGPPGTGKTLAAEAVGYEVGRPLKVVNCGELLSKWVGESTKNIDSIFQEARQQDAILVFDEAEGLFGQRTSNSTSTDRYANVDVGVLLYHIEHFPGIVILTTNLYENIDKAFFRRLKFILQFDIPNREQRMKLWKLLIPEECPVADDVDCEKLARLEMTGGHIKSAVFRAAARAALRIADERKLMMEDLEQACEEECGKGGTSMSFRRQDSLTQGMYN